MVQELVPVLAYPKVPPRRCAQRELMADYLPWVTAVDVPDPAPLVPACRDKNDLPFLHLATVGKARVLVSGDADLLALAGRAKSAIRFEIMAPVDLMQSIGLTTV